MNHLSHQLNITQSPPSSFLKTLDADKAGSLHMLAHRFFWFSLWCQWEWQEVGNICVVSLDFREDRWDRWNCICYVHRYKGALWSSTHQTNAYLLLNKLIWTGSHRTIQICTRYFTKREKYVFSCSLLSSCQIIPKARFINSVFRRRCDGFCSRHMLCMYQAGAAGWSYKLCVILESVCEAHHHLLFVQIMVEASEQRMITYSCINATCSCQFWWGKFSSSEKQAWTYATANGI